MKKGFLKSLWYILNSLILENGECYFDDFKLKISFTYTSNPLKIILNNIINCERDKRS